MTAKCYTIVSHKEKKNLRKINNSNILRKRAEKKHISPTKILCWLWYLLFTKFIKKNSDICVCVCIGLFDNFLAFDGPFFALFLVENGNKSKIELTVSELNIHHVLVFCEPLYIVPFVKMLLVFFCKCDEDRK